MDKIKEFQAVVKETKSDLEIKKKEGMKKLTAEIKKLGSDDEILKWINGFNDMIEVEAKDLLRRAKLGKIHMPRMIEHVVKKNHAVRYGELWVQSAFGEIPNVTIKLINKTKP